MSTAEKLDAEILALASQGTNDPVAIAAKIYAWHSDGAETPIFALAARSYLEQRAAQLLGA